MLILLGSWQKHGLLKGSLSVVMRERRLHIRVRLVLI